MNRDDFDAWESRIRDYAEQLWQDAGRPEGGPDRFQDDARALLALKEVPPPTLDPNEAAKPVIEEAAIQGNLGEFPTLTDQGEEQTYPHPQNEPRLSDGDASEDGGVLPTEEVPKDDLPDISVADADVTSSAIYAEDDPPNADLNDDGVPDPEDLDQDSDEQVPVKAEPSPGPPSRLR